VHILANGSFTDPALRQLNLNPFPHPVGGVPLFPRRLPVGSENRIDEVYRRLQLPARPFGLLPRFRQSTADRFAHHPPVYSQLLCHPGNRSHAELILSTDLFEQLHFASPVQRVPPLRASPESEYPSVPWGGPKQTAELGHFKIPKSAVVS